MGKPTRFAAAQTPTALGRSSSLKSTARAETAITITPAPARPTTIRATTNCAGSRDAAQATEPSANSPSEPSITFVRPKRSPSNPAGSIAAASTKA